MRKVDYAGIAALITAVATAIGAMWSIRSERTTSTMMQKSIVNLVDWRLTRVENKLGLEPFTLDMLVSDVKVEIKAAPSKAVVKPPTRAENRIVLFEAIQKHVDLKAVPVGE